MMNALFNLGSGVAVNYISNGLLQGLSNIKDKQELQSFKAALEDWALDFQRSHDGSIAARGPFADYVKNYHTVEAVIRYVILPDADGMDEQTFLKQAQHNMVQDLEEKLFRKLSPEDVEVVNCFLESLLIKTKAFVTRRLPAQEQVLLYGLCQLQARDARREKLLQEHFSLTEERFSRLLEMVNVILSRTEGEDERLPPKQELVKYTFGFEIGADGRALELSNITQNAIREWFYDCAREDLSSVPDEHLADTFTVTIDDERVNQAQDEINAIDARIKSGEILDPLGEHRYSEFKKIANHIKKENQIKAAAIKFYLSDRIGYGLFNTFEYRKLLDIVIRILELPYFNTYELDNNREYIMLEVYLNFSGHNQSHERFTVHMKECDVKACFGGTGLYDIYGRTVSEMGKYRRVIAPYFYQHLGSLKVIEKFDFSQNMRILNLYNYYVGLD